MTSCKKRWKAGELAQSRGSSPQVREFGMMMANDHRKANDELRELAQQNGYANLPLTVPSGTQEGYDQPSFSTVHPYRFLPVS